MDAVEEKIKSVKDVATLVQGFDRGHLTAGELVAKILELSDRHDLDALTDSLPSPLREEFVGSTRRLYDNDRPAETFKCLHFEGHMPPARLAGLRAWLARQPKSAS